MPEKIALSPELINAILSFLAKQPYENVMPLISAIHKEAEAQIIPPEAETEGA